MSRGVLYIGTSESYFLQAVTSAESLKKYNNIKTSIITSSDVAECHSKNIFDEIIAIDKVHNDLRDKVNNMHKTPYDRTLFLDTDTIITGEILDAFDLLDRVEIAAATPPLGPEVTINAVPDCFPELNTGVIAFRSSTNVFRLFESWGKIHKDQIKNGRPNGNIPGRQAKSMDETYFGRLHDQPPFREALFKNDLTFAVLPQEYNFRGYGASTSTRVKIVHDPNREVLSKIVNKDLSARICFGDELCWRDGKCISLQKKLPVVSDLVRILPLGSVLKKIGIYKHAKTAYDYINNKYGY